MNVVSVNDGTNDNRGVRQYTVNTGNASQVDIQLFPADFVTVDQDGNVTFRDTDSNNRADAGSPVGAITVVNGVGNSGTRANNVTPNNGQVTFTVNSTDAGSVVPVVFADNQPTTAGDNELQLTAPATSNSNPKAPAEAFGIGGRKTWVPTEQETAVLASDVTVTSVNKDMNYFVTGTGGAARTWHYDENDTFRIASIDNGGCVNTTLSNFEANLSTGDEINGDALTGASSYTRERAAASNLCLEDISPGQVTSVEAQPTSGTAVTVTWAAVSGAQSYNIYRVVDTTPATDCPVATTLVGTSTTTTFNDTTLTPETTYCYQVAAVADGDEGAKSDPDLGTDGANDAKATTLSSGATAAPQSEDVRILTDTNFPGEASPTDQWRIIFSEPMNQVTTGDVLRVQDAQGEFRNAVCDGAELTCTFNASPVVIGSTTYAAGRVLTVIVGTIGALSDNDGNAINNNGLLDYPLTITSQNGFFDLDPTPKAWVPSASPDNVIDQEAGTQATTQVAPTASSANQTAPNDFDTLSVTFSEPVLVQTVGDFRIFTDVACAAAGTVGSAIVTDDATTVVINTAAAMGADGNTRYLRVLLNAVDDRDGNGNPLSSCIPFTLAA